MDKRLAGREARGAAYAVSGKSPGAGMTWVFVAAVLAIAGAILAGRAPRLAAAPPGSSTGRWLHVKVDGKSGSDPEMVRVNIPLELAEKVLPAINAENMRHGRVILEGRADDVDLPALLEAVRSTADGEFITVRDRHNHVRVAKAGGYLVVKVQENEGKHEKGQEVEIKVPFSVAQALFSAGRHELDLAAAVRALQSSGDTELVNVEDQDQTVRIWVDSRNTAD